MRYSFSRRSIGINLRCARVATPEGATFLVLSAPVSGGGEASTGTETERPAADVGFDQTPAPQKSRFIWTLDEHGRFGPEDPVLGVALGANAPRPGESLEEFRLRASIEDGVELARILEQKETFSDLVVICTAANREDRLQILLSGAPAYDRRRDFAGYRGFGVLGERIRVSASAAILPDQQTAEPSLSAASTAVASQAAPPISAEPSAGLDGQAEEPDLTLAQSRPPEGEAGSTADLAREKFDGSESSPALQQSTEAYASPPQNEKEQVANEPRPPETTPGDDPARGVTPGSQPERTAEIYVLRQTAASSPAKIVPIRPNVLDTPPGTDPAQGVAGESVALSKSERDAFREIARALVGKTHRPRSDRASDATPAADGVNDSRESLQPSSPENELRHSHLDDGDPVRRNAFGILDRLPVGVLIARDARALYLNHTLLALLGYRDLEHLREADGFAAMFRGGDPQAIPPEGGGALSIVRSDGQSLAVDGHAQAVNWDGAPATLIALTRATDAELAEKGRDFARESRARNGAAAELQEMLDRATDGAVTLDSAGRILSLNKTAERLFGYEEKDIAGESLLMLLAPQSHLETTGRLESLSVAGESAPAGPLTVVGRRRNGAGVALALTLARIGPPEAFHYCALLRNLSGEQEAEHRIAAARDAALAASSAKTDFLAQVSHEIRTPLHAILGFSEVMMEERFGPIGNERYKDYLRDIHASGRHVMSLADDLLDLSKIESGKLELAFAPVDANGLIRECVSLMQPQAARERIIMRISLFDHLPRVMVDERSLRQIMLNLMSNAVKFNEPGGQVIVSTAVDATGQAVIRVRDTGVGMSENEIDLALEPFGQIGRPGQKGGAGLGLPLTKALVEANKAEFSIKSRREHGTLIEIAFPNIRAAQ
jgi:PAS domain S-box-containing protein